MCHQLVEKKIIQQIAAAATAISRVQQAAECNDQVARGAAGTASNDSYGNGARTLRAVSIGLPPPWPLGRPSPHHHAAEHKDIETMTKPSPRSHWLLPTLRCLTYCIALSLWTRKVLLEPLRGEAIEMVCHLFQDDIACLRLTTVLPLLVGRSLLSQAHMDPTEIIALPASFSRLETFVGFSVFCLFVISVPWWDLESLWKEAKVLTSTTAVMLAISILCGAHPQTNLRYTILASAYVASLLSLNPPVFNDSNGCWNPQQYFFYSNYSASETRLGDEIVGKCRFYATLLVMMPFQVLTILDSGLQVQRWPLPMVLGSTVGWVMGSVIGLLLAIYTNLNAKPHYESHEQSHQQKDRYM